MKLIDEKEIKKQSQLSNGYGYPLFNGEKHTAFNDGFKSGAEFAEQKLIPLMIEFAMWCEINYQSRTFPDESVLWFNWRNISSDSITTEQLLEQFIKNKQDEKA